MVNCSLTPLLVKIANTSLGANQTFPDESEQRRPEQTHTFLVTLPSPPQFLFWAFRTLCLAPVNSVRSSFWTRQPVLTHNLFLTSFLSIFLPCSILVSVAIGTTQLCGFYHSLFQASLWALTFPRGLRPWPNTKTSFVVWQHVSLLFHKLVQSECSRRVLHGKRNQLSVMGRE